MKSAFVLLSLRHLGVDISVFVTYVYVMENIFNDTAKTCSLDVINISARQECSRFTGVVVILGQIIGNISKSQRQRTMDVASRSPTLFRGRV